MLNVSVGDAPAELRGAVLAMKRADAAVRRDVAARMRDTMNPVWRSEVAGHASGVAGQMFTAGTRIAGGNPAQLVAAASRRKIGRGLIPDRHWAGFEYGANRASGVRTVTSRKGTKYRRHVMNHLPPRGDGRSIEPAVKAVLPRIAAFWTQSVVRAFMDAADGKG